MGALRRVPRNVLDARDGITNRRERIAQLMGKEREKVVLAMIGFDQCLLAVPQDFLHLAPLDEIARLSQIKIQTSKLLVGRPMDRTEMRRDRTEPRAIWPDQRRRYDRTASSRARHRSKRLKIPVELDVLNDGAVAVA